MKNAFRYPTLSLALAAIALTGCRKEEKADASTAPAADSSTAAKEVGEVKQNPTAAAAAEEEEPKPLPPDPTWKVDYKAALAEAQSSGKDLLLDFTGSDWCIYCILLDRDVFHTDTFRKMADESFVRVRLDFPRDKTRVTPAELSQNADLAAHFLKDTRPEFPLIYLLDNKGRPYGLANYEDSGPAPFLAEIEKLKQVKVSRDKGIEEAASLEGMAKVDRLVSVLRILNLPEAMALKFYPEIFEDIKKNDPQDTTGLRHRDEMRALMAKLDAKVSPFVSENKIPEAIEQVDLFLKENTLDPGFAQQITLSKALMLGSISKQEEAIKVLDEAIAMSPDSPTAEKCRNARASYKAELDASAPAPAK